MKFDESTGKNMEKPGNLSHKWTFNWAFIESRWKTFQLEVVEVNGLKCARPTQYCSHV